MGDIVLAEGSNELNIQLTPIYVPPPVANLYGIVTNIDTGLPISGVKVTIDGLTTYTNNSGMYGFEGLTPGAYTIIFKGEGYVTETR